MNSRSIFAWCMQHPIGTVLLTCALVLMGILAFPRLSIAPLPEAEFPTIEVSARLPGASAETMASAVATPLEVALSVVPGITEMTSSSALGSVNITLQFVLEKDIDAAAQEVQAALNQAAGRLPDMPNQPTWRKANPSDSPILIIGVTSETLSRTQISDMAETVLARQLSQAGGRFHIKIIEEDAGRCVELASVLPSEVLVLHGDTTDEDLLTGESVEEVDLFLALTDDDEDNIMSSLLAKRMGAKRVLALINRRSYADLMHGTQIDIALSPAQTMLGELLTYVRRGDVHEVVSFYSFLQVPVDAVRVCTGPVCDCAGSRAKAHRTNSTSTRRSPAPPNRAGSTSICDPSGTTRSSCSSFSM